MNLLFWIIAVVFVGFGGTMFHGWTGEHLSNVAHKRCVLLNWVVIALAVFSPAYLEIPNAPDNPIYTWDQNGVIQEHPFLAFCVWELHDCVNLEPSILTGSVTPITENPKVRKISLTFDILVTNPTGFFRKEHRRKLETATEHLDGYSQTSHFLSSLRSGTPRFVSGELARTVGYHLYDFFNEHSIELSRFSNPLDENQVRELRELAESYLNARLEDDGITVLLKGFQVE